MQNVVVVGGGLVGCCFALDLARQNRQLKISIIERHRFDFSANNSGWDSKIYALTPHNFQHLVENLGLELAISRLGNIDSMKVRGNQNSAIEFAKAAQGASYLAKVAEYRNLHQAVVKQLLLQENIQFQFTTIQDISMDATVVSLRLANRQTIQSQILVAADGANSEVRSRFDFKVEQVDYYQSGVVANFKCEYPHHKVAHQWFSGDAVLAYLPLPDQQISMVWSTDNYAQLLKCSADELCQQVAQAGEYVLGKLSLVTRPQAFPLKLNLVNKFFQNRLVLIGDAAHTIHPLAGQGLNLGFGDAWELASLLAKADLEHFDPLIFARYNYSRLAEVRKMQFTCHLLQRLFHNRLPLVDKLRNLGLNLVNKLPLLKPALISSATNF